MKQATKKRNEEINRHDKVVGTYIYSLYYYSDSREEILTTSEHVSQCGTGFALDLKTLPNGRTKRGLIDNAEYPQELIESIENLEK